MKLDKAIELNTESHQSLANHGFHDHADALKLGIEALKREKQNRDNPDFVVVGKLPGETEE